MYRSYRKPDAKAMKTEKILISASALSCGDQPGSQPLSGRRDPDYQMAGGLGGWEGRMSQLARVDS